MAEASPWWISIISLLLTLGVGGWTTLQTRKSQSESNQLTGRNEEVQRYDKFTEQVQEERNHAIQQRDEALKAVDELRRELEALRQEFEVKFDTFKTSVEQQLSKYRRYIHDLRAQIFGMGGTPRDWPEDLDH